MSNVSYFAFYRALVGTLLLGAYLETSTAKLDCMLALNAFCAFAGEMSLRSKSEPSRKVQTE